MWVVAILSLVAVTVAPRPHRPLSPLPMPTAIRDSLPASTPELDPGVPSTQEEQTVTFTVVYDNHTQKPELRSAWGFSCWVETAALNLLFDTGGDAATLMGNMARLGFDPQAIDAVVLSHAHGDHTGGLSGLLDTGVRPTVYVPAAFPASFKADVRARTALVEVTQSLEISPGIHSTGQVRSAIVEQALAVETDEGVVVVTGCAHPGIVEMVRQAQEVTGGEIRLVLGGFHLGGANETQIEDIILSFRRLGVPRVAPCHCTGDKARQMFADAYGSHCALPGVGWVRRMDAHR